MEEYKNKEWLEEKLKTVKFKKEIGRLVGVSGDTIRRWQRIFNLPDPIIEHPKSRKHFFDEQFFSTIDTEEKAYWLGFIMADGCIASAGRNNKRFVIVLKDTDSMHLEKLNKALKSDYSIKFKEYHDKRGFITRSAILTISSKKLCDTLYKNCIYPNKTGKENIPDTVPDSLKRHFIRGFFDGDGSISKTLNRKYYRIHLGSCSKKILDQIIDYFNTKHHISLKYYVNNNYSKPFYTIDNDKKSTCNNFLHILYDDSTVYLDRKYDLANKMFEICSPIQQCIDNKAS